MTVRVFIHCRDDMLPHVHRSIAGTIIGSSRIAEPKVFMAAMAGDGVLDAIQARTLDLVDNGMLGLIGAKSLPDDQFILLTHRPDESFKALDHTMLDRAAKRLQVDCSSTNVLVYSSYYNLLEESSTDRYFS